MAQIMVSAILRRVVFNNGIKKVFNRGGGGRVPRRQAEPLSVKEVRVVMSKLEMTSVHTIASVRSPSHINVYFLISTSHAMAFKSLNTTLSGLIPNSLRFDSMLSCVHLADQKPSAVATNRDPGGVTTCCPVFS